MVSWIFYFSEAVPVISLFNSHSLSTLGGGAAVLKSMFFQHDSTCSESKIGHSHRYRNLIYFYLNKKKEADSVTSQLVSEVLRVLLIWFLTIRSAVNRCKVFFHFLLPVEELDECSSVLLIYWKRFVQMFPFFSAHFLVLQVRRDDLLKLFEALASLLS